jgi:hypothetical protein
MEFAVFRFSIRDLLWLTLVVAMGLGWWINSQRSRVELEQTQNRLAGWRGATGALEHILELAGCQVNWTFDPSHVSVVRQTEYTYTNWYVDFASYEPSRKDD